MAWLSSIGKIGFALVVCPLLVIAASFGLAKINAETIRLPLQPATLPAPMEIGMNLGMMTYWSQEFAFADIIKSAGLKIIGTDGKWADVTTQVNLDRGGHPIDVPIGTMLAINIRAGVADRLPGGTYQCQISPGWNVRSHGPARMMGTGTSFQLALPPAPQRGGIILKLTATSDRASLSRLSCRDKKTPPGQTFNSQFLEDNRHFSVLRFMDWMKTNNQPLLNWSDRTTPESLLQTTFKGVAVEHMVELANTLDADPWFTMPLDASDDYYLQFARYVHDHLKPQRRAYVEVSNEVWNRTFGQSRQASYEGAARYPTASPVDANDFYYSDRVRTVMGIWSEVYKGQMGRIVRVLASQAGSKNRSVAALTHLDTVRLVDALAIAPYFGPLSGKFPEGEDVTEYLISHGPEYVDAAISNGVDSKAVADRFKLQLITYEGGPAYVSYRPRLAAAFLKAERDPRMYGLYTSFLDRWQKEVGGLFMAFNSVNERYGHLLYTGQSVNESPKMRALADFMDRNRLNRAR